MKERNPDAVCAKCPMFWEFNETQVASGAKGGNCRNRYVEGQFAYVEFPDEEFCTDHPEWALIDAPTD